MRREERLVSRLAQYNQTDMYPFHMPGHKRLKGEAGAGAPEMEFPNPFTIDITEIDGFDNLHHPEGILRESMEWAAGVYGAARTYYLVNGSSSGILASVSACVGHGGRILMARNCHKSAYHGAYLNRMNTVYLYPQPVPEMGIQGGILPEDVEKALKTYPDIRAVLVVSPTYDGIVSDIHKIAEIVHRAGLPLIVDEAHGAHFRYADEFPVSALEQGADLVIQSVHKTLPSLTQTALLHVGRGGEDGPRVDLARLERFLQIYQSSSPSYVLMASIENAVAVMEQLRAERGMEGNAIDRYVRRIRDMRERLGRMNRLKLVGEELRGRYGIFNVDISKVVIATGGAGISGAELDRRLRERYHLEMEMCAAGYATAITSVFDSGEGLLRLERALMEIDGECAGKLPGTARENSVHEFALAKSLMPIAEAMDGETVQVELSGSCGCISGEYIYVYPPGIPIIAPGEEISREALDLVMDYMRKGLAVQGPKDQTLKFLNVVKRK